MDHGDWREKHTGEGDGAHTVVLEHDHEHDHEHVSVYFAPLTPAPRVLRAQGKLPWYRWCHKQRPKAVEQLRDSRGHRATFIAGYPSTDKCEECSLFCFQPARFPPFFKQPRPPYFRGGDYVDTSLGSDPDSACQPRGISDHRNPSSSLVPLGHRQPRTLSHRILVR